MQTALTLAQQLVEISNAREKLEYELKQMKERERHIGSLLIEDWAANGIRSQGISLDGKRYTVFSRRDMHANVLTENRKALIEVCNNLGLSHLVKTDVPTPGLKAYLTELVRGEEPGDPLDLDAIPEELKPLVRIYEETKAIVRRA